MTNNIQGNSHKVISWFLNRKLYMPEGNSTIYLKWWKGRNYKQEYSTQQDSHSDLTENQKLYRQAKVKRIQYHQTSFTANAKGISLGRKHKRRKRPTQNKPKTIKTGNKIIHMDNYLICKQIKCQKNG